MKKKLSFGFFLFLFCVSLGLFAEEPPIKGHGWYWRDGVVLKGTLFFDVAESYKEQDGWAYIEGYGKIHYWLYDTYTYHDGSGELIMNKYIPAWIESMGYVIDFDNIRIVDPNNELASSVKALMKQRGCDVSVTLVDNEFSKYVIINNYSAETDSYWSEIIPLIQ